MKSRFLQPQIATGPLCVLDMRIHDGFHLPGGYDSTEKVTNGTFTAWDSVGARVEDPTGWIVSGEVGTDPEVSEVGTGEGHGGVGTGMCNLYTSAGVFTAINQTVAGLVIGRKYRISINIDTVTAGAINILDQFDGNWPYWSENSTGIKTRTFVAKTTSIQNLRILRLGVLPTNITFDDISIKQINKIWSRRGGHIGEIKGTAPSLQYPGVDLPGTDEYIEIADHDDFTPALTPFSISAWVYMHDATNFYITTKGKLNIDAEWWFRLSDDKVAMIFFDNSVASCYIGRRYNTVLTPYENQWIHLIGTYDGGTLSSGIKIYLNGVRIDDVVNELNPESFVAVENLAAPVYIGRYDTVYANGLIDNVMFFSKALTGMDVLNMYNVTKWRYGR